MLFYNKRIWERCFIWKSWFRNIKEIPLYFKLMHHLIKYGYDEYATWETYTWFIYTMRDILTRYRKNHMGYPVAPEGIDQEEFDDKYDADLDKMIALLDVISEGWCQSNDIDLENAKDEFFKLFSKHFYSLWD